MFKKFTFFFLILLILLIFSLNAENIRGPVKGVSIIDLPENNIEDIDLLAEEILSITHNNPGNVPLKTVIEVRTSERMKNYRDTFAIFFYNRISPAPSTDNNSYNGSLVDYKIIPSRSRYFIELYYNTSPNKHEILPGTDFIGNEKFKNSNLPIIITILPVMKGIPNFLLSENFKLKITHHWPARGELQLTVFEKYSGSDKSVQSLKEISDYTLFIDEIKYTPDDLPVQLNTGIKRIKIEKEGFMPLEQSVIINKNEKSVLDLILTDRTPYLRIISPKEAEIYLNGVLTEKREFIDLQEGQYTVVFKLGQYSLSRKITLENGKRYNLNMLLDIQLKEE